MAAQSTAQPSTSSATRTQQAPPVLTLRPQTLVLRAEEPEQRHIQWAEDVIDNENMGKKSSKVCCIYHKPHTVDSSSDSSSSDSSDSDSDSGDDGRARPIGGGNNNNDPRRSRSRRHKHPHDHNHNHDHDNNGGGAKGKKPTRKRSPNAYEKMPKYGKKGSGGASA